MAKKPATKNKHGAKVTDTSNFNVATNKSARHDYEIVDKYEAGLVLLGSEVKSLREAKVRIGDAFARLDGNELYLIQLHIPPYTYAAGSGHDPDRKRKLLLHRAEIERIRPKLEQERLTLVPLSLYFLNGKVKIELGVARGRKDYDKRQLLAKRTADLEAQRAMSRSASGKYRE